MFTEKKEQKGERMLVKYLKISTLSMYRDENCLFGDVWMNEWIVKKMEYLVMWRRKKNWKISK